MNWAERSLGKLKTRHCLQIAEVETILDHGQGAPGLGFGQFESSQFATGFWVGLANSANAKSVQSA